MGERDLRILRQVRSVLIHCGACAYLYNIGWPLILSPKESHVQHTRITIHHVTNIREAGFQAGYSTVPITMYDCHAAR
jgi:hypothetical protein